jgi:hydroxymethylbilane synthase
MNQVPDRLVLASRGSRLALRQAGIVSELVRRLHPAIEVEILPVRTSGDADKRSPFAALGRGVFTTEVEHAVATGQADVAVHSAKDLTAELAEGCGIVCVPPRAAPGDVVVGGRGEHGEERIAALPPSARVGTSSMRRRVLLAELRPDVEAVDFRGNLETRLRKLSDGEVDVAILAEAGLARLGAPADYARLDEARWIPAPGQGALAIEARTDRPDVAELFAPLDDSGTHAEVTCERAFASTLEGGCSVPLGCLANVGEGARGHLALVATGFLGSPYGDQHLRDRISGPPSDAGALGAELAGAILAAGGQDVIEDIEAMVEVEAEAP